MFKRSLKNAGFTMIEATIAMVVLAVAAAGILMPFGSAAAVQEEGRLQVVATNLATELMEKVLLTDPDLLVSGYDNFTEPKGAMIDTAGNAYSGFRYSRFSRKVSCVPATVASVDMVIVTVFVYENNREVVRLQTMVKK